MKINYQLSMSCVPFEEYTICLPARQFVKFSGLIRIGLGMSAAPEDYRVYWRPIGGRDGDSGVIDGVLFLVGFLATSVALLLTFFPSPIHSTLSIILQF